MIDYRIRCACGNRRYCDLGLHEANKVVPVCKQCIEIEDMLGGLFLFNF